MQDNSSVIFSFVILTFNSDRYIEKCLSSIRSSLIELNAQAEVFVIDNGSHDNTRLILEGFKFSENVQFETTLLSSNLGTTVSRNIGLRSSTGEYIVILDSDAYVNPDVLAGVKSFLDESLNCGLAVPRLSYPDGRYQLSVDQFPTLIHKLKRLFFLRTIEGRAPLKQRCEVDYAISAFWMFRSELLQKVGLLDERIFYSPEDVDYCLRIWQAGYKITYLPEFSAVHDAQEISRSKGFKLLNLFSLSHIKGLIYLYMKHQFLFSGDRFRS